MTDTILATEAVEEAVPQTQEEMNPRQQFIEQLPEELRGDKIFANHESWQSVAKSYANAARMVGLDKNQVLKLPTESREDNPEAWAEIDAKLGKPADITGYEIDKLGFQEADLEGVNDFAQRMHAKGAPKAVVQEALTVYKDLQEKALANYNEQVEAAQIKNQTAIKEMFGEAFESRVGQIKNLLNTKYPELAELAKENPVAFETPAVFKVLSDLVMAYSEDKGISGGETTVRGAMTPSEAKLEMTKFQVGGEYWNIINDRNHPQREAVLAKRQNVMKFL